MLSAWHEADSFTILCCNIESFLLKILWFGKNLRDFNIVCVALLTHRCGLFPKRAFPSLDLKMCRRKGINVWTCGLWFEWRAWFILELAV